MNGSILKEIVLAVIGVSIVVFAAASISPSPLPPTPDSTISFYSGGKLVHKWRSDGEVSTTNNFCQFTDKETGNIVQISGSFIVERSDDNNIK